MKEDDSFDDILNEPEEVETPVVEAEAPAVEAEEVVEEVAVPEIPEGFKQDERGVWHRADGTIASKEEIAKLGKAGSQPETTGQGLAAPVATETPAAPEPTPFKYKALQQEHALDGAVLDAEGNLVVKKDALPQLLPMLARAHEFPQAQSREARISNELSEAKRQYREQSTRAEAAEVAYQHLAAILDDPDRLAAFLTDPREKQLALRELELGIRNARITRESADRAEETKAQTTEQSVAQEVETITSAIDQLAKAPELAAYITPEDIEEAKAYFREMRPAIVKEATDDSLKPYGVSKGEKYVVHEPMQKYLTRIATERKKARDAAEAMQRAAKFNAPQTPKVQPKPKQRPAAVPAAAPKKPGWENAFKGAWIDETDE